jgi:hypothetical protein
MPLKHFFVPVKCSKTGKMVIAHEHRAGFTGAHNRSKSKALIILHRQKFTLGDNTPLTVRQIAQESGVSYGFLKVRFSFWTNTCHYVIRKPIVNESGLAYGYVIAARGIHFVEDIIPCDRLSDYLAEIRDYKSSLHKHGVAMRKQP